VASRYQVFLAPAARRELAKLVPAVQHRLQTAVDRLEVDPRPAGVERLKGPDDLLRIRVGDYRIIFAVFDQERIVKLVDVVRRGSQTYRRLDR